MKRLKKFLSIVLTLCMVLSLLPVTVQAAMAEITVGTGGNYEYLADAIAAAPDGCTIKLLNDINGQSLTYTVESNKTITIDGGGHTLTGVPAVLSIAPLILQGTGTVILKDLTLQGGEGDATYPSAGLSVSGSVSVRSYGTVTLNGGQAGMSYGLVNEGMGTVNVTEVNGTGGQLGIGVNNTGSGTVNVSTAIGTGIMNGIGVANTSGGTVNVTTATGSSTGVSNSGIGTVNVITAQSKNPYNFIGVRNGASGTINAGTVVGTSASDCGVFNQSSGTVNAGTITGTISSGSGTVNTGTAVTHIPLHVGTGASCVLSSITIAVAGTTTIGTLPGVYKDGGYSNIWYTGSSLSNQFNMTEISAEATLYSALFTPDKISTAAISGVIVPVTGEAPVSSIADTEQYTASISWSPNDSVFAMNKVYTATITITPKDGYTLTGVGESFFTVAGAATTNAAGSGVVTAIFPETEQTIAAMAAGINAVSGLTAGINGSTVTVTGTATLTAASDAALTIDIPAGVTVVWKASLSGGGSKYLLEPTGDGTFEVAAEANIVNNSATIAAIYCNDGKGNLMITGGKVSTTGSGMAIGVAGEWLLTMTGGEVSANEANSCTIFGKNSVVITGGTVSATDTSGYQLYMGESSVYRSGVLDTSKIMYHDKGVFAEVCVGAAVTQAVSGTSIGLTVTGHNLSTGDNVTAVWAKQNGESGVNISYYSAEASANSGTTEALETWFLAVPGVTVTDTSPATYTVTFDPAGGTRTGGGELTQTVTQGSAATAPTVTRSGYTFNGWDKAFSIISGNITITASWTYNSNSGNGSGSGGTSGGSSGSVTSSDTNTIVISGNNSSEWTSVENMLEGGSADTGSGSITVDMRGTTVVPGAIFEALRGRDHTVTFALGDGIEWVVNGKDITGEGGQKDIDFKVKLGTGDIPANVLSNIESAGDKEPVLLSLNYEGSFGFSATLRISLDSSDAGRTANLFYYNPSTGSLTLQSVGAIREEGFAELNFTHASDYVIVTDDGETLKAQMNMIQVSPAAKNLYFGGATGKSTVLTVSNPDSITAMLKNGTGAQTISYQSSSPKVASVSDSGVITALKAGKATITTTVTMNGVSVSFNSTITVKKAYIKLVKSTKTLQEGKYFTFRAKGYGVDTSGITWSTTEKSILTINKKTGKAVAKTVGTDYVTAKSGGITIKLKVVIK